MSPPPLHYHPSSIVRGILTYAAPYFDPGPVPSSVNILLGSSNSVSLSGLYNPSGLEVNLEITGVATLSGHTATFSTDRNDWSLIGSQSINLKIT
jgi:hypothetical protein